MGDEWRELARFLYDSFWYARPEIEGLSEDQLYWVPDEGSLCILWHVGHVAHRERVHIGHFLQGQPIEGLVPPQFEVFGTEWVPPDQVRAAVGSVAAALAWVEEVREESLRYIDGLQEQDLFAVPTQSADGLQAAYWLFITTAHTALHLGRVQMLRAMVEGRKDRPC